MEVMECKKISIKGNQGEVVLDYPVLYPMTDQMKEGIKQILSLEVRSGFFREFRDFLQFNFIFPPIFG
jgi:hypothetical protein